MPAPVSQEVKREDTVGTIEHTMKMLDFLESLDDPSPAAQDLIRRYRAEVEAYHYEIHPGPRD